MMKERAMALFIAGMFLASMLGFGLMGGLSVSDQDTNQNRVIPGVVNRQLSLEELRTVLQSGSIVIQDHYQGSVSETGVMLNDFVYEFSGFVVLEQFQVEFQNQTKLQIIGYDGRISELDEPVEYEKLIDSFCSLTYVQPKKCLMRNYENMNTSTNLTL